MYYYGFEHKYGIGITDSNGEEVGALHVFGSRKNKNEWVAADGKRESVGAKAARNIIEGELYRDYANVDTLEDIRALSTEKAVEKLLSIPEDRRQLVSHL